MLLNQSTGSVPVIMLSLTEKDSNLLMAPRGGMAPVSMFASSLSKARRVRDEVSAGGMVPPIWFDDRPKYSRLTSGLAAGREPVRALSAQHPQVQRIGQDGYGSCRCTQSLEQSADNKLGYILPSSKRVREVARGGHTASGILLTILL